MVATKPNSVLNPKPSLYPLSGRLAATEPDSAPAAGGRLAALAHTAVAGRLSENPEVFVADARQQPGE